MIIRPNSPAAIVVASRVRSIALADPLAPVVTLRNTNPPTHEVRLWTPGDPHQPTPARDWIAQYDLWMARGSE